MIMDFKAEVSSIIHGRYSPSGYTYIYEHGAQQFKRRQGVELHEWVHSELLDNTAYGRFQQWLHSVEKITLVGPFRSRCRNLFVLSMHACTVAHEGLAAYRELCWLASNEGTDSAKHYMAVLPKKYREGVSRVTSLLGDPLTDPYKGLTPAEFHTLLITLGSAIMNTPILSEYTDPASIFREHLAWLVTDGPDQRLEAFQMRAESLTETLYAIASNEYLRESVKSYLATQDISTLKRFWDFGIETLRQLHKDLPMLTNTEVDREIIKFNASWVDYINREAGNKVIATKTGHTDITDERSLNIRLYPSDYFETEAWLVQEEAIPVLFDALLETARTLESPNIIYLALLATVDPNPSMKRILQFQTQLLGVPMRSVPTVTEKPLFSSAPSILCEMKMADFLPATADLSELGWCWYTNQTIATFLRELGRLPTGLLFERCCDVKHILLGLDHSARLGTEPKGFWTEQMNVKENFVAIVYRDFVSFSFATVLGTRYFGDAVRARGLVQLQNPTLQVGPRTIPMRVAARWARWGAFGR